MYDIVAKIKALGISGDNLANLPKFYASLSSDLLSLEDLTRKVNYLHENGINITKPSQIKVLTCDFDFIKKQVEASKSLGCLNMFVLDPNLISSKEIFLRFEYLKNIDPENIYVNNKYNKILFNKKEFDRRYGTDYIIKENNNIEPMEITNENSVDLIESNLNIEPIESTNNANKTDLIEDKILSSEKIVQEEPSVQIEETNPYILALSKEQTIRLDDEMLVKYDEMTNHLKHVLESLNYGSEIDETKANNLIKLLTSGISDAREILYYTITYNKNLTDEEKVNIYNAIDNEMRLGSNMEKSL